MGNSEVISVLLNSEPYDIDFIKITPIFYTSHVVLWLVLKLLLVFCIGSEIIVFCMNRRCSSADGIYFFQACQTYGGNIAIVNKNVCFISFIVNPIRTRTSVCSVYMYEYVIYFGVLYHLLR